MGWSTELKRKDPVKYAKGAIEELSNQLQHTTAESKKTKLKARIEDWKKKLAEMQS